jgi:hypothetical protein
VPCTLLSGVATFSKSMTGVVYLSALIGPCARCPCSCLLDYLRTAGIPSSLLDRCMSWGRFAEIILTFPPYVLGHIVSYA